MDSNFSHQDSYLIEGIHLGDRKIINNIYEQYFPRIKNLIENNKGNEADAYDIFQDALMVIYQKSKQADFQLKSTFYTFLYAICRNLWLKRLKKKKVLGVTIQEENVSSNDDDIIEQINQREKLRLYQEKFQALGKDCQRLLQFFFEGISMREIAKTMGISEKYARKRKFICKERLISLIQADNLYQEIKDNGAKKN